MIFVDEKNTNPNRRTEDVQCSSTGRRRPYADSKFCTDVAVICYFR